MFRYLVVFALLCSPALGQDPAPPPVADAGAFVAPKEASGTGKRSDPYTFDSRTKCMLKLNGPETGVVFDTDDAPTDIEAVGNTLIFSLAEPGLFQIIAHGDKVYARCWFMIKSGADPPVPPNPVNVLAAQLRAALVGTDAKDDANKLRGMTGALADALEAGQFPTYKQMHAAWKATQTSNQWPAGKYPKLPDVIRLALPTGEETIVIDATNRPGLLANLRILEATSKAITEGK